MVQIEINRFRNHISLEEQHMWWLDDHAPIARRMSGLSGCTINSADQGEGGAEPDIYGIDTQSFEDWGEAMIVYTPVEWSESRAHTQASDAQVLRTWVKRQVAIVSGVGP